MQRDFIIELEVKKALDIVLEHKNYIEFSSSKKETKTTILTLAKATGARINNK